MAIRRLCYVVVVDEQAHKDAAGRGSSLPAAAHAAAATATASTSSFRYTQPVLQGVLQLIGCKPHHAFKISRRVFHALERESVVATLGLFGKEFPPSNSSRARHANLIGGADDDHKLTNFLLLQEKGNADLPPVNRPTAFSQRKDDEATVTVTREKFVDTICQSLEKYHYVGPSQREDISLACRLRERKESVTILLCGTSGCGKSTLSSLLASRLGITTVVSTDSIRHMMRSFCSEKENPLLWASTYHAGEYLDPVALVQAKARKKNRMSLSLHGTGERCFQGSEKNDLCKCGLSEESLTENLTLDARIPDRRNVTSLSIEQISSRELAIEGYKAQSEMVIDRLDNLITTWEDRKESVVVEGVHLSLNFVMGLMKKHPSIVPFLVYISNEEKHLERFAVRAKYMTLDPSKNKYVKYIRNIRTIQDYLCKRADKHLIPKVNNTNVDRSVASLHSTIFSCLRRHQSGIPFYDVTTNTAKLVNDEYGKHCESNALGSKGMFRTIQRQGSLRRYMAIVNDDGSINKAWPFSGSEINFDNSSSNDKVARSPIYGPRHVHEIEHVYVQFGSFGLGSWPKDTEGSSCARSSSSSRADMDEETSRCTSLTSSPLHQNAHAKEVVEEEVVSESEEEQFNEDDNSSDSSEIFEDDEIGGSVIESPGGSDEEYEEDEDEMFNLSSVNSDGNILPKHFTRTLSIMPSKKIASISSRFSRVRSMPLCRNHSMKRLRQRKSSDD